MSIILHLLVAVGVLLAPRLPWVQAAAEQAALEAEHQRALAAALEPEREPFIFVQPLEDFEALRAPERAPPSDQDRVAQAPERAPDPANDLPFSLGNTPERVQTPPQQQPAADQTSGAREEAQRPSGRTPEAATDGGRVARNDPSGFPFPPTGETGLASGGETASADAPASGSLGETLRDLQRFVREETFDNPTGGGGAFGPSIQFDTKGVEFGPWIRRFVAQVKRNWFIPYAAMSLKGHVVITFNVHKDGRLTDLEVPGPSSIDAFNNAAFNALVSSNPTQPLPPEYPADQAFFTVTFYYNESPPSP